MADTPRCQYRATVLREDGHEVVEICCDDATETCAWCDLKVCAKHVEIEAHHGGE